MKRENVAGKRELRRCDGLWGRPAGGEGDEEANRDGTEKQEEGGGVALLFCFLLNKYLINLIL
jgi:hypothetical protein